MRTIKIKIKHLLVVFSVLLIFVFFGNSMYWNAINTYNKIVPDKYELSVIDMDGHSMESENHRLSLILSEHDYALYNLVCISDGATMSGFRIRRDSGERVFDQYQKYYEAGDITADYALNVALIQWFAGDVERTIQVLDHVESFDLSKKDFNHYQMIRLGIALTYSDVDQVLQSLDAIDDEEFSVVDNQVRLFLKTYYDSSIEADEVELRGLVSDDPYHQYFMSIFDINSARYYGKEDLVEGSRTISGLVTLNGQPLKGAFVYEDTSQGMSSFEGFRSRNFMTDDQGAYVIENMYESTRRLGVLVPWQLVHDKQFMPELEVVEGLDEINIAFYDCYKFEHIQIEGDLIHYELSDPMFDETQEYSLKVRFVDSAYDVNGSYAWIKLPEGQMNGTVSLLEIRRSLWPSYVNTSGEVTFERLMEPLYLSGDYYFELTKSSKDRFVSYWNGLFTDSTAYRIYIDGVEPSEGDLLVKNGDVEKAIDYYESHLDMHSLKVLISLYQRGYIEVPDVDFQPWLIGGVNQEKAVKYLKMLNDEYGEVEGDLSKLSSLYKELRDYKSERDVLSRLEENYNNEYYKINLALNSVSQLKLKEGLDELMTFEGNLAYDYYVPLSIIMGEEENLPEFFKNHYLQVDIEGFDTFFDLIEREEVDDAWLWLMEQEHSDLKTFYQLMMLEAFDRELFNRETIADGLVDQWGNDMDYIEYYREKTNEMKNNHLKKILIEMKLDHNWF